MNDLGVIASGIVTFDFPNDTGSYNMGFVSGWLETNIICASIVREIICNNSTSYNPKIIHYLKTFFK